MQVPTTDDRWREPTLAESFIEGANGHVPGLDRIRLRSILEPLIMVFAFAWTLPDVRRIYADDGVQPFLFLLFMTPIQAILAYRTQAKFGRSRRHGLAAALGVVTAVVLVFVLFIATSIVIAHPPGASPWERVAAELPPDFGATVIVVALFVVLGLVVVGSLPPMRRRRDANEARFVAAVERERAARAAAGATLVP